MRKKAFMDFFEATKDVVLKYNCRSIDTNCKYYGVIVEPRCHPCLEYVCRNFLKFTNHEWGLHIFHGLNNDEFIKDKFKDIANIKYTNMEVENLTIEDYNKFMTNNIRFHNFIDSDHFLVFQTDSILLQEMDNRMMKYDYVGAPWPHFDGMVGNGGFSVRNKELFMKICESFNRPTNLAEDVFYAICLKKINANIAPFIVAQKFSCENIPTNVLPIGCHEHIQNVRIQNLHEIYINNFKMDNHSGKIQNVKNDSL